MEPSEAKGLELGTSVWVWIVRFGKGRWWPATVDGIEAARDLPNVKLRVQSFLLSRQRSTAPITVGFAYAPMRRLERRDISRRGLDRPKFVPASRLRRPETPIFANAPRGVADADNASA
jgi:hypothetical protein